jgi:hypothetical protein
MASTLPFPAIAANQVFALSVAVSARRANHGNPVQIGAFLLVPFHTLENIREQSCWKEHNGTVTSLGRPGPFLLAFQALKEARRKPSAPDAGFLHLFI